MGGEGLMYREGVCYVVYGEAACREASLSIDTLRAVSPYRVMVMGDEIAGADGLEVEQVDPGGRWTKIRLDELSPFEHTLYLDADTRVYGDLSVGFKLLEAGWDMAMTPSANQNGDALWHIDVREKERTIEDWGMVPLQLQAGVFYFRKSPAVLDFFQAWRWYWSEYRDQDQAAFLRALRDCPVKIWLLGRPFNGGAVVAHRFGALRRN